MKTLLRLISVFALVLGLQTALLMAQAQGKPASGAKPASGKATPAAQAAAEKPAAQGQQNASAKTSDAAEDAKSKDPMENMRFRNLGPAVGGGRVTAVLGIPGKANVYYARAAGGGIF